MFAAIDTGTTNTRLYLIDQGQVISQASEAVGVRDSAVSGSRQPLKDAISRCFNRVLQQAGMTENMIDCVIASGMITTELGLIDIPHLSAPVGFDDLIRHAVITRDPEIVPFDRQFVFIPGIKNPIDTGNLAQLRDADFMKGEETQVMGLLRREAPQLPCRVFIFSSHTKIIHVDEDGRITGSITSLSGQVFAAICSQTSIGKSIGEAEIDQLDEPVMQLACDCVAGSGFLRTMLMPRILDILFHATPQQRRLFTETAIAADDLHMLDEAIRMPGLPETPRCVLIGHQSRCRIYDHLLKKRQPNLNIQSIWQPEAIDHLIISADQQLYETLIQNGSLS